MPEKLFVPERNLDLCGLFSRFGTAIEQSGGRMISVDLQSTNILVAIGVNKKYTYTI